MTNKLLMKWINAGQIEVPTLLLKYYRKLSITNDELVLIIQLKSHIDQGDYFPDLNKIAEAMNISKNNAFKAVHQLIQKKLLSIDTRKDEDGVTEDIYSLDLLWEKLIVLLKQNEELEEEALEKDETKNLYSIFEAEFGRPLSPIEMESLVMWVEEDQFSKELIKLALREAVLSQVYSFKYIDRILLNWKKKNIRTKEQVEKESQRFREYSKSKNQAQLDEDEVDLSGPVPMINWLEDDS
ncbi:MAG: DnaD domain-containing protein [Atopostipes suicloacalis]|nr:DnaD domain-containing protein [Atopostipes suicloacalis]MDN6730614.1 DnaD domain-containing protein [Atopostipes suicloacalis]